MIQIVPAILDKTPDEYKKHIEQLKNSSNFQQGWVHIDFADNKFVPNKTVRPEILKEHPTNLKKEAHLMVDHPFEWISELLELQVDRILIHLESEPKSTNTNPVKNEILSNLFFIEDHGLHIKDTGIENGLAVKLDTPLSDLEIYLDHIDAILLMGIEPGFQGRKFEEKTLNRIGELVKIRAERKLDFKIGVDGGVNDLTAKSIVESGADYLVSGSFLFSGNIDENAEKIWEAIKS